MKRSPGIAKQKPVGDKKESLARDKTKMGDFVSTDQFICNTPGQLPSGYGRKAPDRRFQGGTIYNDAASGLIWVENQISIGFNETMMRKLWFKQWLWEQVVAEVSRYNRVKRILTAEEYHRDCEQKGQSQRFSGVGAQH